MSLDQLTNIIARGSECKAFYGGHNWPSDEAWRKFNDTLQGALLKPAPLASVCYGDTEYGNASGSKCKSLSASWSSSLERAGDPIEVNSLLFEGLTCIPPISLHTKGCRQGGYPRYVVKVTGDSQVQTAINFARQNNVRVVIKNTGHDFSGKSLGASALSIWTHHLKDITYVPNYATDGYSGPAFNVGAGVQAKEIYKAAFDQGMMVVGGICDSVGLYGGYSQGGGHSMLSSIRGMGADQILSIQLVTANGNLVTASATENTDLFWAIRGGGGSTYGVVTSMVVKAFPDIGAAVGTFEWSVKGNNISEDTFWKGVSSYFSYFKNFTDEGTAAQWFIYPKGDLASITKPDGQPRFQLFPFFAPGKTIAQTESLTASWLTEMTTLGINITTNWAYFDSYYNAYYSVFSSSAFGHMPYTIAYGSRLVPQENFDKSAKLNATVAAYRAMSEAGHMFNGYQYSPTLKAGAPVGPDGNAIHPAWRNALSHTIAFVQWPDNATIKQQKQIRSDFAIYGMKPLRDVTSGAGSYMNEADRLEPDFQQSFYGDNYARLLQIKQKYDPEDVFWAATAVGSEGWAVESIDGLPTENGPLCRVTN
ncbi:FAD binding domain-containing protein [Amylocarpus encephaloides]|uniref:FAD binding domain-containing protein n=1 Tax=Amylocarpus encephaloides TaxID=45428 RepID=A0A9P7YB95_9HELO|nr:FAD binding domain-containing protein [Amylocarpus encephaloides]